MSSDPTSNVVESPTLPETTLSSSAEVASEPELSQSAADTAQQRRLALKRAGETVEPRLTDEEMKLATAGVVPESAAPPGPVAIPEAPELGDLEAQIAAAMEAEAKQAVAAPAGETPAKKEMPEEGNRLQGAVQSIHGDDVFLDLGFRLPGVLQLRQFEGTEPPQIGAKIQVVVRKVNEEEGLIACNLPRGKQKVSGNWDAVEVGQIVDCVVAKTNKGGLEVTVGSLRGFMPAGQIELGFVQNLESYVGQKLSAKIIEANRHKRNLVVSHKQLLQDQRREVEGEFWNQVTEGQEYQGTVKTIKDYGAFVDLGGCDGFLHIGQISWTHIKHPNEVLSEGQQVNVKVLQVDREKKRISLGMKQLSQNPWVAAAEKYAPESTARGKVTRTTDFGAFVELEPGIEGLIHISELDHRRVRRVTDVVTVGEEVEAKVLDFDSQKKRVSLSLKALKQIPQPEEPAAQEEPELHAQRRRQRDDLRGGIGGGNAGGGLFGNPNDFR